MHPFFPYLTMTITKFNDLAGKYDSPVSIRYVLQDTRVDVTWIDLVVWSPAVIFRAPSLGIFSYSS